MIFWDFPGVPPALSSVPKGYSGVARGYSGFTRGLHPLRKWFGAKRIRNGNANLVDDRSLPWASPYLSFRRSVTDVRSFTALSVYGAVNVRVRGWFERYDVGFTSTCHTKPGRSSAGTFKYG